MPRSTNQAQTRKAIHAMASRFEGVTLGVACPGTKVESRTYCVKGKAFLFVSREDPIVSRFKVSATAAKAKKAGVDFGAGDPSVSARSAAKGEVIQPGQTRRYLVYYRDPTVLGGCPTTSTFNSTQTGRIDRSL